MLNIDARVSRFLKRQSYAHQIVYPGHSEYRQCWDIALDAKPAVPDLPDSFYHEEWERVVLPQRITDQNEYLRARRTGRGVALSRKQRAAIWAVFEELLIQMHQRGLRASEQATQDATDLIAQGGIYLPYDAVVVDEAQDMGPEVMTLLRIIVPPGPNDLFIIGDGHQRISRRRYALSQCGIEVRGRSRRLRINYRTTEETRRFAVAVLEDQPVDDLDGGIDSNRGYRSLMHGEPPTVRAFGSQEEEIDWIADELHSIADQGGELRGVCIVARTDALLGEYEAGLRGRDISTQRISRREPDSRTADGVRLATMHRVKGLQFRYVFVAALNEGVLPLRRAVEGTQDETEKSAAELNERALLHVSASRAVRGLFVSSYGRPSPFLLHGECLRNVTQSVADSR